MLGRKKRHERQLTAAKELLTHVGEQLQSPISVRLWDGSLTPLGPDVDPNLVVSISGPGVIGSILRRPTADNILRHYARGHLDCPGGGIHTIANSMRDQRKQRSSTKISKLTMLRSLWPFLFEPGSTSVVDHEYQGNVSGRDRDQAENLDFIQFHYDVSNEFYELFLDEEMVYTCAYFKDQENSLEQAQLDKMDMTCRKLQLQEGERFLDIGFGWGGLLCHAAKHYGVKAHGITLSENQLQYVQDKVRRLGLEDQVTVEVCDYANLEGRFDKVASICMYEHVGIDNLPSFMRKVSSLMTPHGRFLLQGITRPGKASMKKFRRMNAERRLLAKHIFPGAELDHLGHMIQSMESGGFEISDVEGWRNHYIRTLELWYERLYKNRNEAIAHVGEEKYRMWLLYLVGCCHSFKHGGARLYQVLAEKHVKRQPSGMSPTREHLYRSDSEPHRRAA